MDTKPASPVKQWYAIYTKSRTEKKVSELLTERGIDHYLPLQKVLRQWSDRRKWVHIPLFNSYIFVYITPKDFLRVLETQGVVCFIKFNNAFPPIPEYQINNLKIILGSSEKFEISYDEFEIGEKVEIDSGKFKGLKGRLVEWRGKTRVLVHIDSINQNLIVDIHPVMLKRVRG